MPCLHQDSRDTGSSRSWRIDGVHYSHYFSNTHSGKPIGGSIDNRLNKIGHSFVAGHEQGLL
jgi:hypothetical protein